jgi:hypothetical protein
MNALLTEIHAIPPSPMNGEECKIGTYLRTLPEEDADALRFGLWSKASAAKLAKVLRTFGIDVGATTIKEHRAKHCACTRKEQSNG